MSWVGVQVYVVETVRVRVEKRNCKVIWFSYILRFLNKLQGEHDLESLEINKDL